MPMKQNNAYAGVHEAPDGNTVHVVFVDGTATRDFNRRAGAAIGTREYRRFGWYWASGASTPTSVGLLVHRHGPFTSSRLAYQDAMKRNQRRRVAA